MAARRAVGVDRRHGAREGSDRASRDPAARRAGGGAASRRRRSLGGGAVRPARNRQDDVREGASPGGSAGRSSRSSRASSSASDALGRAGALRELFDQLLYLDSVVVFIDEVEEIASSRQKRPETHAIANELLKLIPLFREADSRLLVCATNSVRELDHAFTRPGRFDYLLPVGPPDRTRAPASGGATSRRSPMPTSTSTSSRNGRSTSRRPTSSSPRARRRRPRSSARSTAVSLPRRLPTSWPRSRRSARRSAQQWHASSTRTSTASRAS